MSVKKILVPTDFSVHSDAALALAASIAKRCKAALTIMHIDPAPPMLGTIAAEPIYIPPQIYAGLRRDHDAKLERDLNDLRRHYGNMAEVSTLVRRTGIVEGIVGHARELETDLIVMGSRGGTATVLLGSHAAKVSREAPCPVLVAHAGQWRDIERALVAVDYSRFSEPAARFAADLLGPDTELELMHAWYEPYLGAFERTLGPRQELATASVESRAHQANLLRAFAEGLDLPVMPACYIGDGSAPRAILARAEDSKADLIVLGAHSREGVVQRVLGTVADRVLRHAQVPVLLFPEDALK